MNTPRLSIPDPIQRMELALADFTDERIYFPTVYESENYEDACGSQIFMLELTLPRIVITFRLHMQIYSRWRDFEVI